VPANDRAPALIVAIPGSKLRPGIAVIAGTIPVGVAMADLHQKIEICIAVGNLAARDRGLDRGCDGPRIAPVRVQTGVDEHGVIPDLDEGTRPEPLEQDIAVRSFEDVVEGVTREQRALPAGDVEQVQVVVAEHASGAESHDAAQDARRGGPPIHEVSHEEELVAPRIVGERFEQILEFVGAALKITDEDALPTPRGSPFESHGKQSIARPEKA
jgi:hypothetical protein